MSAQKKSKLISQFEEASKRYKSEIVVLRSKLIVSDDEKKAYESLFNGADLESEFLEIKSAAKRQAENELNLMNSIFEEVSNFGGCELADRLEFKRFFQHEMEFLKTFEKQLLEE